MKTFTPEQSDAKMKETILFVARECQKDENFGATKLNKILFYADFYSYLMRGESITGQAYFALEEGPAPRRLKPIRDQMLADKEIATQMREVFIYTQERTIPLREPDEEKLEAADMIFLRGAIKHLAGMNTQEVSEMSHDFAGWKIAYAAGEKTTIEYDMVRFDLEGFWKGAKAPALPSSLIEYGKQLADETDRIRYCLP